jgi:AraC-like DNA-binding protein
MTGSRIRSERTFSGSTVSRVALLPIVAGLKGTGVDIDRVLSRAGLEVRDLEDPDLRLPREVAGDVWRHAFELTGDEAFGLHAAERLQRGTMEMVEYLARNSPTVREAIDRLVRYAPLLADELSFALEIEGERARLSFRTGARSFPPPAVEFILAVLHRFTTGALARPVRLREVCFAFPEPADTREHVRLFGLEPRFGREANALVFERSILHLRLAHADEKLGAVLKHQASVLMERIPRAGAFPDRVRQLITEELATGDATAAGISRRLNMSTRTLHRKLREGGWSFRILLDEVRHVVALRYLDQGEKSLGEIAHALGFSDQSAFRKAFRRWTGARPADYLKRKP